jgi:acetyl-CoA synthetase
MREVPTLEPYHFYEREWSDYGTLVDEFEWEVPETFNVVSYVCDRWADDPDRVALRWQSASGETAEYTFARLRSESNALANFLVDRGLERGDRVGIVSRQRPSTLVTYFAAWKLGAVPVPLSRLFGPRALGYRLRDSGARACLLDGNTLAPFRDVEESLDSMEVVLTHDDVDGERSVRAALEGRSDRFETVATGCDEDGVLVYTSGTTGDPKGVRHGHRVLLGHLPQFLLVFADATLDDGDVFWTPSEWAWIASLVQLVCCALFYGRPVVGYDAPRFDPTETFELLERFDVTSAFLPPTALRKLANAGVDPTDYDLDSVRVVASAGEPTTDSLFAWVDDTFDGAPITDAYGQTEANGLVCYCANLMPHREGAIGLPTPGHDVAILDPETAEPLEDAGTVGEIGVRYADDPVCFKEYWRAPDRTAAKVRNGWLLTGDLGTVDDDGYVSFVGRKDDVIISGGYRISPYEIEDVLADHPSVDAAAVVGVPDDERGQVPKAFVVPSGPPASAEALRDDLRQFVRDELAKYEYPREIEFIESLPETPTGKTRRADLRERE